MLIQKVALDWLFCLAIIAMLLLALRLLLRWSGGRKRERTVRGLHGDQRGSVQSLSFVLTLPVFIMIIMAIVQIGQIMLAQVIVEYAALASARAASVWTSTFTTKTIGAPDQQGNTGQQSTTAQQRNCLGDRRDRIDNDATVARYRIVTSNKMYTKVGQIQKAAHMACLPICPSRWPYQEAPTFQQTDTEQTYDSLVKAYQEMAGEHSTASQQAIADRLKKKYAYSEKNTHVDIEIEHPLQSEPPLDQVYDKGYQYNRVYEKGASELPRKMFAVNWPNCDASGCCRVISYAPAYFGKSYEDQCPASPRSPEEDFGERFNFKHNQIGWQDRITVTVTHHLALLPGPGKILSRMMHGDAASRSIGDTVEQQEGDSSAADGILYTWPLVAKASTTNEGNLSILRYEYPFSGSGE